MSEEAAKPTNRVTRIGDKPDPGPRKPKTRENKSEMERQSHILSSIGTGKEAAQLLDSISPRFDKEARRIDEKVFELLAQNDKLDPEIAVQMWVRKYELRSIEKVLLQEKKLGEGAAKQANAFLS